MTFTYLCFFLTLHVTIVTSAEEWCYEIQTTPSSPCKGPREWATLPTGSCGGKEQSPINIVTKKTEFKKELKPFHFTGYDKENNLVLKNNGHSAQLSLEGGTEMTISEGGLGGTFKALQLHFHWGSSDMRGSEHSIDGERYPAEKASQDNPKYNGIIQALNAIKEKDQSTTVTNVKLQDLIPEEKQLEHFYRYDGSLTTHPCDETVTWTVFSETISLGESQIQAFYTSLNYSADAFMEENFRPVQELGARTVYTSGVEAVLSYSRHFILSFIVAYIVSTS